MDSTPDSQDRLSQIEKRLSLIEEAIGFLVEDRAKESPAAALPAPVAPPADRAGLGLGAMIEGNWLGIVSSLCFLLAAGFIVKLAVDTGWLTPPRQIVLAMLLGLSLIVAGFSIRKLERAYTSFLPGVGIAILYLSILAAHSFHHLIAMTPALGFVVIVSVLCIAIYMQIRHDFYLLIAALGSYLSPLILAHPAPAALPATTAILAQDSFSAYYFAACSIAFAIVSVWLESRFLAMTAATLAMILTAVTGLSLQDDVAVVAALAFQFLAFVSATAVHTIRTRKPLTDKEAWAFFPALLLFYSSEYTFIERIAPVAAPWISIGFAAILLGIYFAAARELKDVPLGARDVCYAFVSVVLFHSLYLEILTDAIRPWLFVIVASAVAFVPKPMPSQSSGLRVPMMAVAFALGCEYLKMLSHLQADSSAYAELNWQVVGFVSVASLFAIYVRRGPEIVQHRAPLAQGVLGAAHLLAIFAFYRLCEPLGSLIVSAAWLAYALAVVGVGFQRKDALLAKSALMVLALASAKALLYDAAGAATGLRIVCLLLTGVVLYVCGLILRKIAEWPSAAPVAPQAPH